MLAVPAGAATREHTSHEQYLSWWVAQELAEQRSARGLAPLTGRSDIDAVAADWSDRLAARGRLDHNPDLGEQMCCWRKAGEILVTIGVSATYDAAALRQAARSTVAAWLQSGGHRDRMLDPDFDEVGVGVSLDYATGRAWITADLRDREPGSAAPGKITYGAGDAGPSSPRPGLPCGADGDAIGEPAGAIATSSLRRVSGDDRIETALALSRDLGTSDVVLVASAAGFADSLAAAGFAGQHRAPLLLTGPRRLDARVADRLAELDPRRVVLLGGEAALAPRVRDDVSRAVPRARVETLAGSSRYDTAAAAARILAREGGDTTRAVVVLGNHPDASKAWPDAVSASTLAATHRHPVLLTRSHELPTASRRVLADLAPSEVVVVGGPAAVGDEVLAEIRAVTGASVTRAAGGNRYETSLATARLDQSLRGAPVPDVMVADGTNWPDALAAGTTAARRGAVLLLVDGHRAGAPMPALQAWIADRWRLRVTITGGPAAVTDAREGDMRSRLPCL